MTRQNLRKIETETGKTSLSVSNSLRKVTLEKDEPELYE